MRDLGPTPGRPRAALLVVGLLVVLPSCFTLDFDGDGFIDNPPRFGYERDEIACADGRDNDQDGRIDCEDSDCLMGGFCGEQLPNEEQRGREDTPELCTDGIDNDGDGQFDCGDRNCQSILELCCVTEFDDASCSDRIDNDGNGFTDCQDFSCRNNPYVSVCRRETICDDRIDNDGDRRTDCNDPDCFCTDVCRPGCPGPEDTLARCSDGLDNDGNGFIDCRDFGCSRSTDPAIMALCASGGPAENTAALCMDGIDNDNNGFTDCADRQCYDARTSPPMGAAPEYCAERVENTPERCSDGIDNDNNGFIDCNDNSCRRGDEATRRVCEATFDTCTDRIDNNRNGFADCADFSCRFFECDRPGSCENDADCPTSYSCFRNECLRLRSPCMEAPYLGTSFTQIGDGCPTVTASTVTTEERQRQVRAACTDGIDNDGDGFTDCEDFDCNYNPFAVTQDGRPLCRSTVGRTCLRGPRAGVRCMTDRDCGDVEGACQLSRGENRPLVCP